MRRLMEQVDKLGGAVVCVDSGYFRQEIARSAYTYQQMIERSETVVVGVNKFTSEKADIPAILKVDPKLENQQIERLKSLKSTRDNDRVCKCLEELKGVAESDENIVGPVIKAVENYPQPWEKFPMSLETSGVNIMKRIFNPGFLLIVAGMLIVVAGCSGESQQSETASVEKTELAVKTEPVTVQDTVEFVLNEVIDRVRYGTNRE